MLGYAPTFLLIAVLAGVLGFGVIAVLLRRQRA